MLDSEGVSLASLLKPCIPGAVADLINEIAPEGPRELFRLCRSSVNTRRKLLAGFTGIERLVMAPGRAIELDADADFVNFGRAGVMPVGPPSLRLMDLQWSGSLAK